MTGAVSTARLRNLLVRLALPLAVGSLDARLTDDIRDDTARLPQFFETAARILDIDQKRRRSLAYVSSLSEREHNETLRRSYTNAPFVSLVNKRLSERVESYRFALERLVIMTPSQEPSKSSTRSTTCQAEIARYRARPGADRGSRAEPVGGALISRIVSPNRCARSAWRPPRVWLSASSPHPAPAHVSRSAR